MKVSKKQANISFPCFRSSKPSPSQPSLSWCTYSRSHSSSSSSSSYSSSSSSSKRRGWSTYNRVNRSYSRVKVSHSPTWHFKARKARKVRRSCGLRRRTRCCGATSRATTTRLPPTTPPRFQSTRTKRQKWLSLRHCATRGLYKCVHRIYSHSLSVVGQCHCCLKPGSHRHIRGLKPGSHRHIRGLKPGSHWHIREDTTTYNIKVLVSHVKCLDCRTTTLGNP